MPREEDALGSEAPALVMGGSLRGIGRASWRPERRGR